MSYFTISALIYEFIKTYPFIFSITMLLNLFHYLRTIVIPKNISKLTMALNDKTGIAIKGFLIIILVQIIILLIGMSLYEYFEYRIHDAIQEFHLNKFFKTLFDNREKSLHKKINVSVYSNIVSYTNSVNDMFSTVLLIAPLIVTIIGLLYFIYQQDFFCFLLCFFTMSLSIFFMFRFGKKIKDTALIYNKKKDELIDLNDDINNNFISVLAFNKRSSEKITITKKIDDYLQYFKFYNIFKFLFIGSFAFSSTIILIIILIIFYKKMKLGLMTKSLFAQALVIFISFMISTVIKDIRIISHAVYKYGKTRNCLNSINRYYVKSKDQDTDQDNVNRLINLRKEMGKGVDGTEMGKGVDGTEMGKGVDGTENG